MKPKIPYYLAIAVVIVSLACGVTALGGPQTPVAEVTPQPTESQATQAPAPTKTPTPEPTETRVPTDTPVPTPVEYVITDLAFEAEIRETCGANAIIQNVEGDSFEVGGQLSLVNGVMTIWCYGAKHTWTGTLQYAGYTFASDADDSLQFILEEDGYHYLVGTGVVTEPDGTQVELSGGASSQTVGQDDFPEPTASPALPDDGTLDKTGFELVYEDTFWSNVYEWPQGEDDNDYATMNWTIENGVFTWRVESKQGLNWYIHPEIDNYSDFIVSVDLLHVTSSQNDDDAGLLVRKLDDDNFCNFTVDNGGYYTFQCLIDAEWETVLDWTYSDAFNPEQVNTLSVKAVGSHFTFAINNIVVAEADFDKIDQGKLGLAVDVYPEDTTAVYEFDNFEVMAPEE